MCCVSHVTRHTSHVTQFNLTLPRTCKREGGGGDEGIGKRRRVMDDVEEQRMIGEIGCKFRG